MNKKDIKALKDAEKNKDAKTESKNERSVRVGTKRIRKLLNEVRLIKNLATPNYEYTEEQKTKMFSAIDTAIIEMKEAFSPKEKRVTDSFNL